MKFLIESNVANALMACVPKKDVHEYFCGIHIDVDGEETVAVATDGHSLLVAPIAVQDADDVPKAGLILPRVTGDVAKIDTSEKLVRWNGGRTERVSELGLTLTNTYPDWRAVLKARQNNAASVSKASLRMELVARIERELSRGFKQPIGSRLTFWDDGGCATVEFDWVPGLQCLVMGYRFSG